VIGSCVTIYTSLEQAIRSAAPTPGSAVEYRKVTISPGGGPLSNVCIEAQKYLN
jgi:hypothetical protein